MSLSRWLNYHIYIKILDKQWTGYPARLLLSSTQVDGRGVQGEPDQASPRLAAAQPLPPDMDEAAHRADGWHLQLASVVSQGRQSFWSVYTFVQWHSHLNFCIFVKKADPELFRKCLLPMLRVGRSSATSCPRKSCFSTASLSSTDSAKSSSRQTND